MPRALAALLVLLTATAIASAAEDPPSTPTTSRPTLLGEASAEAGRLDEARAILARLRPLDPKGADELAEAIQRAAGRR